jgi:ribulose-5-phosphate 4-epimerase/fuculose-1-phosphate aldolase
MSNVIAAKQGASAASVRSQVSAEEWDTRLKLAACYRLMAHFGIEDLTYNHVSARIAGEPEHLLINPPGLMFREITASSLLKYDLDGQPLLGTDKPLFSAYLILHARVMQARRDVNAIAHTHSVANVAVSAHPRGLLPLSQHSMMFYNRVVYHDFKGFEFETPMAEAIIRDLGQANVALLRNHGAYVVAPSIPELFVVHHFLEFSCRAQVAALSMTPDVVLPPPEVCEYAASQVEKSGFARNGRKDWDACIRLADRLYPDYQQ